MLKLPLCRPNISAGVRLADAGGLRVVLAETRAGWVGLVADSSANTGVSATNGFLQYAEAAARLAGLDVTGISWLERDTLNRIDQARIVDEAVCFQPWLAARPAPEQLEKLLPLFGHDSKEALTWALAT